MKTKASKKKKAGNGIQSVVSRRKKSVVLTERQIKICCSLIQMAQMHLSQFDRDCARMFGWESKPTRSLDVYMEDVAEIKRIFDAKRGN